MVRHNTFNKVINSRKAKFGLTGLASTAAMAAFFVASGGAPLAALGGPSCNVPSSSYGTIQAAVDDDNCNTIKVAAGDRAESVTVDRAVTIKGAKAGSSADNRNFSSNKESRVTGVGAAVFTITAPNVTIDGFSLTNPNQGLGIVVKTAGNNAVLKNNIVDTIGGVNFASNTVGMYLENGPDNVKIDSNKFNNIQSGPSAQGVLVGDSTASDPSLKVLVKNNTITNVTSTRGAYGIQANNGASSDPSATGYSEVKIVDNTIRDLKGDWAHAIGLEGETPNATVRRNVVSNLTDVGPSPVTDIIGVNFEDNQFFFTSDVNRNSLNVGATGYGVAINPDLTTAYPSLSLDANCNWWGAANGPGAVGNGSGSKVTVGVDYNPMLKSNRLDGKCSDNNHHDYWQGDDWDWGHDNR